MIVRTFYEPEAVIGEGCEVWRHTWQRWEGWEAVYAEIEFDMIELVAHLFMLFIDRTWQRWQGWEAVHAEI